MLSPWLALKRQYDFNNSNMIIIIRKLVYFCHFMISIKVTWFLYNHDPPSINWYFLIPCFSNNFKRPLPVVEFGSFWNWINVKWGNNAVMYLTPFTIHNGESAGDTVWSPKEGDVLSNDKNEGCKHFSLMYIVSITQTGIKGTRKAYN